MLTIIYLILKQGGNSGTCWAKLSLRKIVFRTLEISYECVYAFKLKKKVKILFNISCKCNSDTKLYFSLHHSRQRQPLHIHTKKKKDCAGLYEVIKQNSMKSDWLVVFL